MLCGIGTDIGFHDGFEYRIFKLTGRDFYYLPGYLFTFDGGYLFVGLSYAPPAYLPMEPCVSYHHILLSNATAGMWCLLLGPCSRGTLTGVTTTSCFDNHQQGRGTFGWGPGGQMYIHTAPADGWQPFPAAKIPQSKMAAGHFCL